MRFERENYKKYLKMPIRDDRKPLHEILPLKQPLRVLIDPCDICNFRCDFCFQSKMDFAGRKMTIEMFKVIMMQLMEFADPINVIHMYGLGEPLINENLPYFISKIKKNNVAKEVAVTSNGSLLTEEMSKKLIESGLDRLSISLNGIRNEHFKNIAGVEVDFNKVYDQIKYFYKIRGGCHLHIKINGDSFSEDDKATFVYLFKDYADSLNIDHTVNVWPGLTVTENSGLRMYDYDLANLNVMEQDKKAVCPLMFYELLIHSDGSVSPCAVDYNFKNENLGNVMEDSIKKIWESNKLLEIRRQALRGDEICYSMCQNCKYTECAATVNITSKRDELLKKY